MSYVPSWRLGDVHSKWEVSERRELAVPSARLDAIVRDAIITVASAEPVRKGDLWHVVLPKSASVFDIRELIVVVRSLEDASEVEATVTFDASSARIGATMWLFSSIVGIPAGLAWRGVSIRNARRFARTTLDALFSVIERTEGAVYR
ncbi:MAG TPA: hypothetical protein VH054_13825 [Polyangiaceae bacterium]|nr:hypothetical protein [Polyangiaceae bacterium]